MLGVGQQGCAAQVGCAWVSQVECASAVLGASVVRKGKCAEGAGGEGKCKGSASESQVGGGRAKAVEWQCKWGAQGQGKLSLEVCASALRERCFGLVLACGEHSVRMCWVGELCKFASEAACKWDLASGA